MRTMPVSLALLTSVVLLTMPGCGSVTKTAQVPVTKDNQKDAKPAQPSASGRPAKTPTAPKKQPAAQVTVTPPSKREKNNSVNKDKNNKVLAGTKDPQKMVQGVIAALAAKDYEAFKQFTCLRMKKNEFRQFMKKNNSSKVVRVWDADRGDFSARLKANMREAFDNIQQEARRKTFDWSRAQVTEVEASDDVEAELVSGKADLSLHLDDCFVTPQGILMFDAPRAR